MSGFADAGHVGQQGHAAEPETALLTDNILPTVYREEICGFNGIKLYRMDAAIVCSVALIV